MLSNSFFPSRLISRQDMITILRSCKRLNKKPDTEPYIKCRRIKKRLTTKTPALYLKRETEKILLTYGRAVVFFRIFFVFSKQFIPVCAGLRIRFFILAYSDRNYDNRSPYALFTHIPGTALRLFGKRGKMDRCRQSLCHVELFCNIRPPRPL